MSSFFYIYIKLVFLKYKLTFYSQLIFQKKIFYAEFQNVIFLKNLFFIEQILICFKIIVFMKKFH